MALTAGIVGLPNVGKSTLFNAITKAGVEAANYPFATIDPNVGVVEVPDERLQKLTELVKPKKTVPTTFEFRCFEDENITHVAGKVDPIADIETINLELVLADLESVDKRIARVAKIAKTKDKDAVAELAVLEKIKPVLEDGQLARTIEFTDEELPIVKGLFLLTTKPMLYIANISEDDVAEGGHNQYVQLVEEYAAKEDAEVVVICARVEEEVAELEEEEKQVFLEEMGIETSGLDILIQKAYHLLGLATYFTAGEQEVRAWTFRRGMKAPQCAGIIHSDFERGFIRAETVAYADLLEFGSMSAAKENGKVRQEGKEYIVQDGDVMLFRFNV